MELHIILLGEYHSLCSFEYDVRFSLVLEAIEPVSFDLAPASLLNY